jgi:hypothetical protein
MLSDPFSWSNVLPSLATTIAYDGATCSLYTCFCIIVFFWIAVIDSARSPGEVFMWPHVKVGIIFVMWTATMALGSFLFFMAVYILKCR